MLTTGQREQWYEQGILCGLVSLGLFLLWACQPQVREQSAVAAPGQTQGAAPAYTAMTFGWPFLPPAEMQTRGGITRGSEVVLQSGVSPAWVRLQQPGLSDIERDRRAILAMQGAYRTSFQFIETAGFTSEFTPARPYFSWGTEYVHVLEDRGDFISLQHTMVMYFAGEDGSVSEPMVMKHWRQDWQYEASVHWQYVGDGTWERGPAAADASGQWSQWVYQVDDSPRYQATGRWEHGLQYSAWQSAAAARPLPRREYSVRQDYNLLLSQHTLTITPNGWVHEQANRKIDRQQAGEDRFVAREIGVNRYELIQAPDMTGPAMAYWELTGEYWQAVRGVWQQVFAENDLVAVRHEAEGKALFEIHFDYAARLEGGLQVGLDEQASHARATIESFLVDGAAAATPAY